MMSSHSPSKTVEKRLMISTAYRSLRKQTAPSRCSELEQQVSSGANTELDCKRSLDRSVISHNMQLSIMVDPLEIRIEASLLSGLPSLRGR